MDFVSSSWLTDQTPTSRSSDFVITRMITDRIGLHSVLLPLLIYPAGSAPLSASWCTVWSAYATYTRESDRLSSSAPFDLKPRFHVRFLMWFRSQNAPYPTLREYFFCQSSRGWEIKFSHIIWRHPSFQFLLTWLYFFAVLRD